MDGHYLGIKQWRSASEPPELAASTVSKANLFAQGLVITIFNPKSLIFIAAFLPQFIDTARPLGVQFKAIVPTFLLITFTVTSGWALVAGKVGGILPSQQAFQAVLRAGGGFMIIAGAGLALARRGN